MVATALVLTAAQTSLWFLVFGRFPAPMFWLVILVYVSVTRPLWEATLMVYLLTLVNVGFTVFPFEALLVFSLTLMILLLLIRERVYWGGSTYFMLMVGVASISAPILYWINSRWFDDNPIFLPEIFDWLIAALLSMLFSFPVYRLYQWFDHIAAQGAGGEGRLGPR